jgi:hypothetical protein
MVSCLKVTETGVPRGHFPHIPRGCVAVKRLNKKYGTALVRQTYRRSAPGSGETEQSLVLGVRVDDLRLVIGPQVAVVAVGRTQG